MYRVDEKINGQSKKEDPNHHSRCVEAPGMWIQMWTENKNDQSARARLPRMEPKSCMTVGES